MPKISSGFALLGDGPGLAAIDGHEFSLNVVVMKMKPNPDNVLGRRIAGIWQTSEGAFYSRHHLELEGGYRLKFTDDGQFVESSDDLDELIEAVPEASLSAPSGPLPSKDIYVGVPVKRVLVSVAPSTDGSGERPVRVYVVLENGYYVSSGPEFYFTELECDRFERWFPKNKFEGMMRDCWTGEPVNPFGASASKERWHGARIISEGSGNEKGAANG